MSNKLGGNNKTRNASDHEKSTREVKWFIDKSAPELLKGLLPLPVTYVGSCKISSTWGPDIAKDGFLGDIEPSVRIF